MTLRVHQLLAGASAGDAITHYAIEIRNILNRLGIQSFIFSIEGLDFLEIFPLEDFFSNASEKDLVLYHFSIDSAFSRIYLSCKLRKIMIYHNITPPKFFLPFSDGLASLLLEGRGELQELCRVSEKIICDSGFNAEDIPAEYQSKTEVIPLFVPTDYLNTQPDQTILQKLKGFDKTILFVGRMVPNKRIDDVLFVFAHYQKMNPSSLLVLAGACDALPSYTFHIQNLIKRLNLQKNVLVTGKITLPKLIAYYQSSNAFLCCSEHEGFCMPLIESMHFQIPVFALAKGAVPETMNGTGVLFNEMDHLKMAGVMFEVLRDSVLVSEIIKKQKEKLKAFTSEKIALFLEKLLNRL